MTVLRVLVVLSSLVVAPAAAPPPEKPGDTLVRAGRDLYRGAGPRNVAARLEGTELLVSHRQMRCAQCHGADGGGGTEGGVVVPPLRWPTPGVDADGSGEASPVARYDEARFMRAVAQGVDSEGRPLSPVMPRFDVTPREAASLFAYLRALADDRPVDPGIATDRLRLGAVLPLSGSLAAQGKAVAATLRAFADTVNRDGGVYGRRIEFVIGPSGDSAASAAKAMRSLGDGEVFALVASADLWSDERVRDAADEAGVPLIGPLMADGGPPHEYTFDLMPTRSIQLQSLVDFFAGEGCRRIAVAAGAHAAEQADARAVLQAIAGAGLAGLPFTAATPTGAIDAVIVAGGQGLLDRVLAATSSAVEVGAPLTAVGGLLPTLPPTSARRLRIASPLLTPGEMTLGRMRAGLEAAGEQMVSPGLQALAWSSAEVALAGLREAGAAVTRESLRAALSRLEQIETAALPPVGFRNRGTAGQRSVRILTVDTDRQALVPLTGWREPGQSRKNGGAS